jgi:CheY-like chemotaxis protein
VAKSAERDDREAMRRLLERLDLDCRPAPGGRAWVVRLAIGSQPFAAEGDSLHADRVLFSTVGKSHIKCLAPRPLFYLPLISIAGCGTAAAVEVRIREAWRARQTELKELRRWLEKLGGSPERPGDVPVVELGFGLEDPDARARFLQRGVAVLPGRGPLSGLSLRRAEDRVFQPDRDIESRLDLDLAMTSRIEALVRLEQRLEREARIHAAPVEAPRVLPPRARSHRVLLVGPRLQNANGLSQLLRVRGYDVTSVLTSGEALDAFLHSSFDLVLTDSDLGRYEGIELIMSLRGLDGVEEVPLVLVDDRHRDERKETARRLGAAGYLTHPIDIQRIQPGLARLVESPRRRRFRRYLERLSVRAGSSDPELTCQIGRGGMLLLTERELTSHAVERYELALPGDDPVGVDGEVVYRMRGSSLQRPAAGVRFHSFSEGDEERLIAYLRSLEPEALR